MSGGSTRTWVVGLGVGAFALLCCGLGPAVVGGALLGGLVGAVTNGAIVGLLAFACVGGALGALALRRARRRTSSEDQEAPDSSGANVGR